MKEYEFIFRVSILLCLLFFYRGREQGCSARGSRRTGRQGFPSFRVRLKKKKEEERGGGVEHKGRQRRRSVVVSDSGEVRSESWALRADTAVSQRHTLSSAPRLRASPGFFFLDFSCFLWVGWGCPGMSAVIGLGKCWGMSGAPSL